MPWVFDTEPRYNELIQSVKVRARFCGKSDWVEHVHQF